MAACPHSLGIIAAHLCVRQDQCSPPLASQVSLVEIVWVILSLLLLMKASLSSSDAPSSLHKPSSPAP